MSHFIIDAGNKRFQPAKPVTQKEKYDKFVKQQIESSVRLSTFRKEYDMFCFNHNLLPVARDNDGVAKALKQHFFVWDLDKIDKDLRFTDFKPVYDLEAGMKEKKMRGNLLTEEEEKSAESEKSEKMFDPDASPRDLSPEI